MVISYLYYLRVKQKTPVIHCAMNYLTMFIRPFSFFFNAWYFLLDTYLYLHFIHNKNLISNEFRTFHLTMYIKLSLIKEKHDNYLISISLHILKVWAWPNVWALKLGSTLSHPILSHLLNHMDWLDSWSIWIYCWFSWNI
jgi:hypothetical protein